MEDKGCHRRVCVGFREGEEYVDKAGKAGIPVAGVSDHVS
jgi:hypothetical protein